MLKYSFTSGSFLETSLLERHLHREVWELIEMALKEGFILTLVGGAVRDFLREGSFPWDLDFELRHREKYEGRQWEEIWEEWIESLRGSFLGQEKLFEVEPLCFLVFRLRLKKVRGLEIEMASARLEEFEENSPRGHRDGRFTFMSHCSYEQSFKRRDFTLNAMGIEFTKKREKIRARFIDPFGGQRDLEQKKLRPCGNDFFQDPVRFCRAIRFSQQFKFSYSKELIIQFKKMSLDKLSPFHFFKEGFSHDFFSFFCECHHLMSKCSLVAKRGTLLGELRYFLPLMKPEVFHHFSPQNREELFFFLIYAKGITEKEGEIFFPYSGWKRSLMKRHFHLREVLEELCPFNWDDFKKSYRGVDFESFLKCPHLNLLKKFHHLYSSIDSPRERGEVSFLPLLKSLNPLLGKTFEESSSSFGPVLRGKERFYRDVEKIPPQRRGDYLYYCHFKELFS